MNTAIAILLVVAVIGGIWYARSRAKTKYRVSGPGNGPRDIDGK